MLAHAWSGPQATSIWVEIVEERKRQLKRQIRDGLYDSTVQLSVAVSEDLCRNDLAFWDASTRAFLQVADKVQIRRQKQLMLIVNNVNLPVNQGNERTSTYSRVTDAWTTALNASENLFNGQSQNVSKGSVLLGLSSWHLYPNLIVLGDTTKTVDFGDPVIQRSGTFTIGLHNPDLGRDEGVYWSLSLSHLKFYGDPVKVTSFTTRDASRLDVGEFQLLIFGSVIAGCGNHCPQDIDSAADFFVALDGCIQSSNFVGLYVDWKFNWIRLLGDTCRAFLTLCDTEKAIASSIVALGHRRGRSLLCSSSVTPPPHARSQFPVDSITTENTRVFRG
jgi:hypothetical protein